jgi:hypothetical protein
LAYTFMRGKTYLLGMKTTRQIFQQIARLQELAEQVENRSAIDAQVNVLASLLTRYDVVEQYASHDRTAAFAALTWLRHDGPDLATVWEGAMLIAA